MTITVTLSDDATECLTNILDNEGVEVNPATIAQALNAALQLANLVCDCYPDNRYYCPNLYSKTAEQPAYKRLAP